MRPRIVKDFNIFSSFSPYLLSFEFAIEIWNLYNRIKEKSSRINEFLENIVLQKKKENPKLSLEEIHENIILEFNPDLQKKVPKQKPLNTVKMQ